MRSWPRWVLPGLAVTLVLALLAMAVGSRAVERDLAGRVAARLSAGGQTWARVAVDGRAIEVAGTAPTPALRKEAIGIAAATPGVASVSDVTELLALASPYVWSARRQAGGAVELSGFVPTEQARDLVLAAAERSFPRAAIHDGMELGRGAPSAFDAWTTFALDRLAALGEGVVTLDDGVFSLSGTAAAREDIADPGAALATAIPDGMTLGTVEILPPRADPFVWSATRDNSGVTLNGFVPSDEVRARILAEAATVLPGLPLDDRTVLASGGPESFEAAARFGMQALAELKEGSVMLGGDVLDVVGVAESVEAYHSVTEELPAMLPADMTVAVDDIAPAAAAPYEWRGEKDGANVVLTGYAPSRRIRAILAEAGDSLFAGMNVTDNVRVAAGAPKMDWVGAVEFAMAELAKLDRGRVVVGDRTFSIEGEAGDPVAFEALIKVTGRTLPASFELVAADVQPPEVEPYRMMIERLPQHVRIAGFAPSLQDRQAIAAAARREFAVADISNDLTLASGAPENYLEAVTGMLRMAARLSAGSAGITDTRISVGGVVYSRLAAAGIEAMSKELIPDGFRPELSIVVHQVGQPLSRAECAERLTSQLDVGRIDFSGGDAEVAPTSHEMLDRVSATLLRCPDTVVEVGAHSDADGSEESNLELTEARAQAVVEYLVDTGIRRERLIPVGYGEARPIADNQTEEGKAANRRVDFAVRERSAGQ